MTRKEMTFRLRETLRRQADRLRYQFGAGAAGDAELSELVRQHQYSIKSYLEQGPARRFYPSLRPAERLRTAGLVRDVFPNWFDAAIDEAQQLLQHRVKLLGFPDIPLDAVIDWHFDPTSGFRWPRRFWADYDLGKSREADPKIIHELNRQQYLPRLAKAFCLTGDERYAQEAVEQLEGWIDQNPVWCGVNWTSSLELAFRTLSWTWTIFMLLPASSFHENAARRICHALFKQIDHIYRYPSLFSRPSTRLLGEAAALFIAGLLFSELPRAAAWRDLGAGLLLEGMHRQVGRDGVHGDASSYYHCYATDLCLQTLVLARTNRFRLPDWVWSRLSSMVEFVMYMTRPDGSIPLIGDDDGGRALALSSCHYGRFGDSLSSAAVLFGRSDFKHQADTFFEETLWLLGEDAWSVFRSLPAHPPADQHRFWSSGYVIQRSGWDRQDSHMIFACSDSGMTGAAHGHADALSLTLFGGGAELLIDPGTFVYNCAPEWRSYFRSCRAHNTVVVDGRGQSGPSGPFGWAAHAGVRVLGRFTLPGIDYIEASHGGFTQIPRGIEHHRRLLYIRPNYWIVLDELKGGGIHDYEFLYHFAPEARLVIYGDERRGEIDCRVRVKKAGLHLYLYGSNPVQAEVVCGQTAPIQGWASQQYGASKPSPVLKTTMTAPAPVAMMSFLIPGEEADRSRQLRLRESNGIAAVVRDRNYEDIAVLSTSDGKMHLMDYVMQGELFWMRTENGVLRQLLAINARSFTNNGEAVVDSEEPIPYVLTHFWENGMVIEHSEGKVYVRDQRDRQFQGN